MVSSTKPSLLYECITVSADLTVKQVSTLANVFLPLSLPQMEALLKWDLD